MKLTFVGTGSAFTVGMENFHSNILLEAPSGKRLLIDCGSDARFSLYALGFDYNSFDDVYISHLHADHAGGLEWLGFCRKFMSDRPKPRLHLHETLVKKLWAHTLSGGMKSLSEEVASLNTYFDICPIKTDGYFVWESIRFKPIRMEHVHNGRNHVPSYGLFFNVGQKHIFITTDNQFSPDYCEQLYKQADVIFHDCETSSLHSGVHAHFDQLKTLPAEIKRKIWLYHYNPGELPDAKKFGFCGFVQRGHVFYLD